MTADRDRARAVYAAAVAAGRLTRAARCSLCDGSRRPIHGHHDDYSEPLAVRWMCAGCHSRHHVLQLQSAIDAHVGLGDLSCASVGVVSDWARRVLGGARAAIARRVTQPDRAARDAALRAIEETELLGKVRAFRAKERAAA